MEDNYQKIIDEFIEDGALEVIGIDQYTKETMYRVTPKMKKINPAFYNEHQDQFYTEAMYLWELGFLEIDVTEENPIVKLLPSAFDDAKISQLPSEKRFALEDIKRILMKE